MAFENIMQLIRDLAEVDLADPDMSITKLVADARILVKEIGPKTRSYASVQKHDDYQAVAQLAVAIDREGKLHTNRRLDCEPQAAIPLMAATRNIVRGMDSMAINKTGLSPVDFEDAVNTIDRGMTDEDYHAATRAVDEGSRTNDQPDLRISEG